MDCVYYFFPKHPAAPENEYHVNLRKLLVTIFVGHLCCMIVAFGIVSFGIGLF